MTVVRETLFKPGTAVPWTNAKVTVALVGPGFVTGGQVLGEQFELSDDTGLVSFDLTPTVGMTPTGCYYVWTGPDGAQWSFTVPSSGGPYTLQQSLISAPQNPGVINGGMTLAELAAALDTTLPLTGPLAVLDDASSAGSTATTYSSSKELTTFQTRRSVSVLDPMFACPTDGTSDCLAAFEAARDYAGQYGRVEVPGRYMQFMLSAQLTLSVADQEWFFAKTSTVKLMNGVNGNVLAPTAAGVSIDGRGILDGNAASQTSNTGAGIIAPSLGADDLYVGPVRLRNGYGFAIHGTDVQNAEVDRADVKDNVNSSAIFFELTSAYTGAVAAGPRIHHCKVDRTGVVAQRGGIVVHGLVTDVADVALAAGSTLTSASNAFTSAMADRFVIGTGIEADTTVATVPGAGSATLSKPLNIPSLGIANRSQSGTTAKVGVTTVARLAVGDTVAVAGTGDANFDGTWVITAVGPKTISFTNGISQTLAVTTTAGTVTPTITKVSVLTAWRGTKVGDNTVTLPDFGAGATIPIEVYGGCYGSTVTANTCVGGSISVSVDRSPHSAVTGNAGRRATSIGIEFASSPDCTCVGNALNGEGLLKVGITLDGVRQPYSDNAVITGNNVTALSALASSSAAYKSNFTTGCTWGKNNARQLNGNTAYLMIASTAWSILGGCVNGNNPASTGSVVAVTCDTSNYFTVSRLRCRNFSTAAVQAFTAASNPQLVLTGVLIDIKAGELENTPTDLSLSTNTATDATTIWSGAGSTGAPTAWAATTAYAAGQEVILPTGGAGYRRTAGTSRSTFDATERAAWSFLPGGHYEKITATGSWIVPTGISECELHLMGNGGPGGGGGAAALTSGTTAQVGGSGGGAGAELRKEITGLTSGDTATITIGTLGTAGTGGAASTGATGNAGGAAGVAAGNTVALDGVTYTAVAGGSGQPGAANSNATVGSGVYGFGATSTSTFVPGNGGVATSSNGTGAVPTTNTVGGGAGQPASATLGGLAGSARTAPGAAVSSHSGNGGSTGLAGANGTAPTEPGCGGGGGGGGAPGGKGGDGALGAAGFAVFRY